MESNNLAQNEDAFIKARLSIQVLCLYILGISTFNTFEMPKL